MPSKKLYRVTTRGLQYSGTGLCYGVSYVVATDPSQAYQKVYEKLRAAKVGFSSDRELDKIELLAEEAEYPECKTLLYT